MEKLIFLWLFFGKIFAQNGFLPGNETVGSLLPRLHLNKLKTKALHDLTTARLRHLLPIPKHHHLLLEETPNYLIEGFNETSNILENFENGTNKILENTDGFIKNNYENVNNILDDVRKNVKENVEKTQTDILGNFEGGVNKILENTDGIIKNNYKNVDNILDDARKDVKENVEKTQTDILGNFENGRNKILENTENLINNTDNINILDDVKNEEKDRNEEISNMMKKIFYYILEEQKSKVTKSNATKLDPIKFNSTEFNISKLNESLSPSRTQGSTLNGSKEDKKELFRKIMEENIKPFVKFNHENMTSETLEKIKRINEINEEIFSRLKEVFSEIVKEELNKQRKRRNFIENKEIEDDKEEFKKRMDHLMHSMVHQIKSYLSNDTILDRLYNTNPRLDELLHKELEPFLLNQYRFEDHHLEENTMNNPQNDQKRFLQQSGNFKDSVEGVIKNEKVSLDELKRDDFQRVGNFLTNDELNGNFSGKGISFILTSKLKDDKNENENVQIPLNENCFLDIENKGNKDEILGDIQMKENEKINEEFKDKLDKIMNDENIQEILSKNPNFSLNEESLETIQNDDQIGDIQMIKNEEINEKFRDKNVNGKNIKEIFSTNQKNSASNSQQLIGDVQMKENKINEKIKEKNFKNEGLKKIFLPNSKFPLNKETLEAIRNYEESIGDIQMIKNEDINEEFKDQNLNDESPKEIYSPKSNIHLNEENVQGIQSYDKPIGDIQIMRNEEIDEKFKEKNLKEIFSPKTNIPSNKQNFDTIQSYNPQIGDIQMMKNQEMDERFKDKNLKEIFSPNTNIPLNKQNFETIKSYNQQIGDIQMMRNEEMDQKLKNTNLNGENLKEIFSPNSNVPLNQYFQGIQSYDEPIGNIQMIRNEEMDEHFKDKNLNGENLKETFSPNSNIPLNQYLQEIQSYDEPFGNVGMMKNEEMGQKLKNTNLNGENLKEISSLNSNVPLNKHLQGIQSYDEPIGNVGMMKNEEMGQKLKNTNLNGENLKEIFSPNVNLALNKHFQGIQSYDEPIGNIQMIRNEEMDEHFKYKNLNGENLKETFSPNSNIPLNQYLQEIQSYDEPIGDIQMMKNEEMGQKFKNANINGENFKEIFSPNSNIPLNNHFQRIQSYDEPIGKVGMMKNEEIHDKFKDKNLKEIFSENSHIPLNKQHFEAIQRYIPQTGDIQTMKNEENGQKFKNKDLNGENLKEFFSSNSNIPINKNIEALQIYDKPIGDIQMIQNEEIGEELKDTSLIEENNPFSSLENGANFDVIKNFEDSIEDIQMIDDKKLEEIEENNDKNVNQPFLQPINPPVNEEALPKPLNRNNPTQLNNFPFSHPSKPLPNEETFPETLNQNNPTQFNNFPTNFNNQQFLQTNNPNNFNLEDQNDKSRHGKGIHTHHFSLTHGVQHHEPKPQFHFHPINPHYPQKIQPHQHNTHVTANNQNFHSLHSPHPPPHYHQLNQPDFQHPFNSFHSAHSNFGSHSNFDVKSSEDDERLRSFIIQAPANYYNRRIYKRSVPILKLIADPNVKLDMPKTMENIGTVAKNSFEDEKAPMFHIRNMVGSAKNVILAALRVPPQDAVIPTQYKIMDRGELKKDKPPEIVSRFLDESDEDRFINTFKRLGLMLRESIKSGQETLQHMTDVAHSARKAVVTTGYATPRFLTPYVKATAVKKDKNPEKLMLIAPRIGEVTDQESQPDPTDEYVKIGDMMDAFGVSNPEKNQVGLTRFVMHPKKTKIQSRFGENDKKNKDFFIVAEHIDTEDDSKKSKKKIKDVLNGKSLKNIVDNLREDILKKSKDRKSGKFDKVVETLFPLKNDDEQNEIMKDFDENVEEILNFDWERIENLPKSGNDKDIDTNKLKPNQNINFNELYQKVIKGENEEIEKDDDNLE